MANLQRFKTNFITTVIFVALTGHSTLSHSANTLFDISVGQRTDKLRWSIAGPGGSPNILSELSWRRVKSLQATLGVDSTADNGFRFIGSLTFGNIDSGSVQDSDYLGDDRTIEFSRSIAETSGDDLSSINIAIGKAFKVPNTQGVTITPLIGVTESSQDYTIQNGLQIIDLLGSSAGSPINALDSTYDTEWSTAFLGAQLDNRSEKFDWYGRVEYHDISYDAEANWNLRSDFRHPVSFVHEANGSGILYKLGGAL